MYVDDHIFMSPEKKLIDKAIQELIAAGLKQRIKATHQEAKCYGSIKLSQPALFQSIMKDIKLGPSGSKKALSVPSTKIMQHAFESKDLMTGSIISQSQVS